MMNQPTIDGENPPIQAWCQSGGRQEVLPSVGLAFSSRQKPQQLGAPGSRVKGGGRKLKQGVIKLLQIWGGSKQRKCVVISWEFLYNDVLFRLVI